MKTKVLIISFLIVSLCLAFSHIANSQVTYINLGTIKLDSLNAKQDSSNRELIADETWLTNLKTGAKIITYSESAFQTISLTWGKEFKAIHLYYKHDRNGQYKEYNIITSQQTSENIRQWAKKNL